jgi:hypothetical protein
VTQLPAAIAKLLRRVRFQVRLRRAERGAWRGAFWGAVAAVAVLAMKGALGELAVPAAAALIGAGALAGALAGACRRVDALAAARLADRALRLDDRVATSLEYAAAPARSGLVDALLADTSARVAALPRRRMVARSVPRAGRALALPLAAAAALALAPPLPDPQTVLPEWFGAEAKERRDQKLNLALLQQRGARGDETLRRDRLWTRDAAGGHGRRPPTASENPAQFEDKALVKPSSDFSSFLKRGDERLRVLGETDKLPDLQSDFASSKFGALARKRDELAAGLKSRQLSPRKLAELLREMERLGRKIEEEFGADAFDGYYDAMERGETDEALEAMDHALGELREQEGRQRDARRLRGGRAPDQAARDADSELMAGAYDDAGMEGEGIAPGRGTSTDPRGRPTPRLRSTPYTSALQGAQRGRLPLYETQSAGSTARANGPLPSVGVFGQYRRMMEDAIAREQVPRDYHEQIRDYFKSLDER